MTAAENILSLTVNIPNGALALMALQVAFVYPFGPRWLGSNRGELCKYHRQGVTFGSPVGIGPPLLLLPPHTC